MAELERIANHLGDIGAICNDAAFALMLRPLRRAARAGAARPADRAVRPPADDGPGRAGRRRADRSRRDGGAAIAAALDDDRAAASRSSSELYDDTASLQDRTVDTGIVSPELAAALGAGGHVGRASGRNFDARRDLAYPPYDRLALRGAGADRRATSTPASGCGSRRSQHSLRMVEQIWLAALPDGPILAPAAAGSAPREGMAHGRGVPRRRAGLAVAASPTGGAVARCHLRDPSWFQWPLLEAAIEGNIVADFPLCNKSFNCSYSGHDL